MRDYILNTHTTVMDWFHEVVSKTTQHKNIRDVLTGWDTFIVNRHCTCFV